MWIEIEIHISCFQCTLMQKEGGGCHNRSKIGCNIRLFSAVDKIVRFSYFSNVFLVTWVSNNSSVMCVSLFLCGISLCLDGGVASRKEDLLH